MCTRSSRLRTQHLAQKSHQVGWSSFSFYYSVNYYNNNDYDGFSVLWLKRGDVVHWLRIQNQIRFNSFVEHVDKILDHKLNPSIIF